MWKSKIGNEAKPLVLALTANGGLLTFSAISGPGGQGPPILRLRRPTQAQSEAVSFELQPYLDLTVPPAHNAQRYFSAADFALLTAGEYIAEVDGEKYP